MDRLVHDVESWLREARASVAAGTLGSADLDRLAALLRRPVRQRLLYLRATDPTVDSQVIATICHEPVAGDGPCVATEPLDWPYGRVKDALLDGWQIIHFPSPEAPYHDTEIDMLGYEFVLHKLETYDD